MSNVQRTHSLLYLGVAIKFPIEVDAYGRPVLVTGKTLLEQSMKTILSTALSSKFFQREWGARVQEAIFEPNDNVLEGLLTIFIKESLDKWEKRVIFTNVTFTTDSSASVNCWIAYKINGTNSEETFVYPFYKKIKH